MIAGIKIISLVFLFITNSTVQTSEQVNFLTEQTGKLEFDKYYEPYVLNFEPNAPGYMLPLDINDIVNFDYVNSITDINSVSNLIRQNGFSILEGFGDNLYEEYVSISDAGFPVFVTTDSLLHAFHIQFDWSLMTIERHQLVSSILDMTIALKNNSLQQYNQFEDDLKEAAKRNVAYFSVAQKILDPNCEVLEIVSEVVSRELSKINTHRGLVPSDIFIYEEDYSQYVPRGHYMRSEALIRYFKTMIWYGRMGFLLNGGRDFLISEHDAKIQTLQAILLVNSLEKVQAGKRTAFEILERAYKITSFFIGLSDDLTPFDYLSVSNKVLGKEFDPSDLTVPGNLDIFKNELMRLPPPHIHGGIGGIAKEPLGKALENTKGMRLLGQRCVPDSRMFQNLIYPEIGRYEGALNMQPFNGNQTSEMRCYPRGLDLMAILGSDEALQVLEKDGDTNYTNYLRKFEELKSEFDQLRPEDWNRNLYWLWLFSLKPLLEECPEGYPNFMRTSAWQKRNLNTVLASWTELRHDTILYDKPAAFYAGEIFEGDKSPPPGYVEPALSFYTRLLALTRMTLGGLKELDVLSTDTEQRLRSTEDVLNRLIVISGKELHNQRLSEDEYDFIKDFKSSIKKMTSGIAPSHLKTTVVADVFSNLQEGLVLEEGVGKLNRIVVACTAPDGSIFLAIGPLLSYYEFKQPMNNRLTDEQWLKMLNSPQKPERPKWYISLMNQSPSN